MYIRKHSSDSRKQETHEAFISHLIASDDMNHNHQISGSNEPRGFVESNENIVRDPIPESPITDKGHGEVANRNNAIGHDNTTPHRDLGRLLGCRGYGGLDLQHNIMPGICKCNLP